MWLQTPACSPSVTFIQQAPIHLLLVAAANFVSGSLEFLSTFSKNRHSRWAGPTPEMVPHLCTWWRIHGTFRWRPKNYTLVVHLCRFFEGVVAPTEPSFLGSLVVCSETRQSVLGWQPLYLLLCSPLLPRASSVIDVRLEAPLLTRLAGDGIDGVTSRPSSCTCPRYLVELARMVLMPYWSWELAIISVVNSLTPYRDVCCSLIIPEPLPIIFRYKF